MGYPDPNQAKVPDLPERYRYQQTIHIEVSDNIIVPGRPQHRHRNSHGTEAKIPDLPDRYRHQQTVPVEPHRSGFQHIIPIQLSNNIDLPPSYEATVSDPDSHRPPRETRSDSQSTSGSNAQAHHNLISNLPGPSQPPPQQAHAVDTKGYLKTDPMAWEEKERSGAWEKHAGEAGCCGSSSGGCCFSSRGGCCFSDRDACCFSDRDACCFSDRGGCCFSDTGGCCFSKRGACCFSKGPR